MLGDPSSVTTTVNTLVELFGAGTVQLNRPVFGSIEAPAGAPGPRLKVRVLAGASWSVGSMKKSRWLSTSAWVVSCAMMSCERQVNTVWPGRLNPGSVIDAGK